MKPYLLKFSNIPSKKCNQKFLTLAVPDSFNLYFFGVLYTVILNLTLRTHAYGECTKYRPKPKNFMIVHSEILSMKDKLSHLATMSLFPPGYPICYISSCKLVIRNIYSIKGKVCQVFQVFSLCCG